MDILVTTILLGIVNGSVYALSATGLVLTYKTSGVLNFGYGALALFCTFVYWQMAVVWGWPLWLAALVVLLVVAPLIGVFLDTQLFRRIQGQPAVIAVIATVGLIVLVQGLVLLIWGPETRPVPSLFPGGTVSLPGGANIGVDQLGVFGVAAAAAGALAALFRFTKIGIAFRAVVDNRTVAGIMGINTKLVSGLAWALGTSFAALAGILLTPRLLLDVNFLPPFIIAFVLGAAVVGYMRSLPMAYAGGIFIGLVQALIVQYSNTGSFLADLSNAIPFVMITALVVAAPKVLRLAGAGSSFIVQTRDAAREAAPMARVAAGAGTFAILALLPALLAQSWQNAIAFGLCQAIVLLSLVILTGYSGQISLGHTAFMGIGAFSAAHLVADLGLDPWIAYPLGVLAAVPAGALIGFLAVRLHGLWLALMTLAFAFMAQELFFNEQGISGGPGGIDLPRPAGLGSDTAYYYIVLVSLAGFVLLAVNLRTGRTGRVLAAMRDSETAARALGINVVKYKVVIFSLSAAIAGVGGILWQMFSERATSLSFIPFYSLIYLTLAVIGGIFHVGGAIVAGLFYGLYPQVFKSGLINELQLVFFGLGSTLALAQNPEGMFGQLRRLGHAILRALDRRATRRAQPAPVAGGQE